MFCRLSPLSAYLVYFCCGWSSLQHDEQTLEGRSSSLCQYFYTAVTLVARITAEAKGEGFVHNEIAIANSLNPSMNIGMEFLNVIRFVLACHGLHNSTLSLISPVVQGKAENFKVDFSQCMYA